MADNPITLSSGRIQVLPAEATRQTGFTHYFRVKYSDINEAGGQGDTVTVTLGSTPANWLISRAGIYVKTAFAYTSGSATLTGMVGTTSDTDALVEAASIKTAGWKNGQVVLTDSSTGTASNTLAALADIATSGGNTYADSAVNAKLAIIKNALASLAAKVNLVAAGNIVRTGTSSTGLKLVLTCENAAGGEPDNINAGELFVFVHLLDLDAAD